jgi:hypothetical protein
MFIQEHNCETGEVTQRNLTAKEIKDRKDQYDAEVVAAEAKAAAKQAILDRIGLTADELKTILG